MCTGVYHTKVYECVSMSVTVLCSCCSSAESEELTYLFWHSLFCWTLTLSRILRSWKTRPLLWILSLALLTHLFWRLAHSLFFPTSMWPKAAIQPRFLVLFIYIYTHLELEFDSGSCFRQYHLLLEYGSPGISGQLVVSVTCDPQLRFQLSEENSDVWGLHFGTYLVLKVQTLSVIEANRKDTRSLYRWVLWLHLKHSTIG